MTTRSAVPTKTDRIAVIGAGAGGLIAARTLKELGYGRVTVFEREARVGGKMKSVVHEGLAYDLGAVVLSQDYEIALRIAAEAGIGLQPVPPRGITDLDRGAVPKRLGKYASDRFGLFAVIAAAVRYWRLTGRHEALFAPGFAQASPELYVPFADYARGKGIDAFSAILETVFLDYGYGDYSKIPALYVVKLWDKHKLRHLLPLVLGRNTGWPAIVPRGFQSICEAAAVGLDVRTNSPISRVERTERDGGVEIQVTTPAGTERFDRLIVAAPLDLSLSFLDASAEETDLFRRLRHYDVWSTLFEADALPQRMNFMAHPAMPAYGRLVGTLKPHAAPKSLAVGYQYGDGTQSAAQQEAALRAEVKLLGAEVGRVLAQEKWRYFPHVLTADLQAGFFPRVEALQGVRGTYYTGGALSFESVSHVMNGAAALVRSKFG